MNQEEKNKSYVSGFIIMGHIITILSIVGWLVVLITTKFTVAYIFSILSDIFFICLVYGLGGALTRINTLDNLLLEKQVINETELDIEDKTEQGVTICKKCGYQIFADEKECSNCGEPKE